MKVRRIFLVISACGLLSFALGSGAAQAAKGPKAKVYTYCVSTATESECFKGPFEVFHRTFTWHWEETNGTYTVSGKSYDFRETGGPDELRGTRGKHGIISGRLYENGAPTEFSFTLTPS